MSTTTKTNYSWLWVYQHTLKSKKIPNHFWEISFSEISESWKSKKMEKRRAGKSLRSVLYLFWKSCILDQYLSKTWNGNLVNFAVNWRNPPAPFRFPPLHQPPPWETRVVVHAGLFWHCFGMFFLVPPLLNFRRLIDGLNRLINGQKWLLILLFGEWIEFSVNNNDFRWLMAFIN